MHKIIYKNPRTILPRVLTKTSAKQHYDHMGKTVFSGSSNLKSTEVVSLRET